MYFSRNLPAREETREIEAVALVGRGPARHDAVGETDDADERRAQLVRHGRKEVLLRARRVGEGAEGAERPTHNKDRVGLPTFMRAVSRRALIVPRSSASSALIRSSFFSV